MGTIVDTSKAKTLADVSHFVLEVILE